MRRHLTWRNAAQAIGLIVLSPVILCVLLFIGLMILLDSLIDGHLKWD